MEYQSIKLDINNGVAVVTLNQPKMMNALVQTMLDELMDAVSFLQESSDVRAVVLTGEGRSFCAGGDINRFMEGFTQDNGIDYVENVGKFIKAWVNLKKPTIAAVNGAAVGAGLSLMLMCDMSVVSEKARIQCAFINMGLVPDCALGYFLPRAVGVQKAKELILTGRMIDAEEALSIGLAGRVVPAEDVLNEAVSIAEKLASGPYYALRMSKRLVNLGLDIDLNSFLSLEAMIQTDCFMTEDSKEAVTAFLEKRTPVFKGKQG